MKFRLVSAILEQAEPSVEERARGIRKETETGKMPETLVRPSRPPLTTTVTTQAPPLEQKR